MEGVRQLLQLVLVEQVFDVVQLLRAYVEVILLLFCYLLLLFTIFGCCYFALVVLCTTYSVGRKLHFELWIGTWLVIQEQEGLGQIDVLVYVYVLV